MAQAASLSLRAPAEPNATPVPPVAPESPATPATPPTPPAIPAAVAQPPPTVQTPGTPGDDDAEPSAEVLAALGDPGKRALQAERDKRKAAIAKQTELQAEIDRLKALTPAAPAPVPPPAAPAQPATPPPTTPSVVVPTELARCETFEQVDQVRSQAANLQAAAMELNTVLATEGLPAAIENLKANGVETFRGTPVDQLTAAGLAKALSSTWNEAQQTQTLADRQKATIQGQRQSFAQAVNLIPGLKVPGSAQSQLFDGIVAANPQVKQLGPQWPLLVARQILGMEAERARTQPTTPATPPPAVPAITPAPAPAMVASAPGAPRTSAAHVPAPDANAELIARLNSGQATEADMAKLASSSLAQGDGRFPR